MNFKTRWNDLLINQAATDGVATSMGGDAARLFLESGDESGIKELYDSALGDYIVAHDAKDRELTSAIGRAWKVVSDSSRAALRRGGFTISFVSLPAAYKAGSGDFAILTLADSKADKLEKEREANEKRQAVREKAMEKQQIEEAERLRNLTCREIAESIRTAVTLSGITPHDLVIALLQEDGEKVRMTGALLSSWYSLAEQAAKAEAEAEAKAEAEAEQAARRMKAVAARQAARQAAKAKQAEAA